MTVASFTISRSVLRQGGPIAGGGEIRGGGVNTLMRNPEGFMCCLGAIGLACGIPAEHLENREMPYEVVQHHPEHLELPNMNLFAYRQENSYFGEEGEPEFIYCDTDLSDDAAKINDDSNLTHEQREAMLIERFAKDDIELIFID